MMIRVCHRDEELAMAVIGFRLDLCDRSLQLLVSFPKMRQNPISVHGSTILGGSIIVVGGFFYGLMLDGHVSFWTNWNDILN